MMIHTGLASSNARAWVSEIRRLVRTRLRSITAGTDTRDNACINGC